MNRRSYKLRKLYDGLRAADTILAKAVRVDPLVQAAKIETRLRKYIDAQWNVLSALAGKAAAKSIRQGTGKVTDADIDKMMRSVDRIMGEWDDIIADRYTDDLKEVYGLAHNAAMKKGLGKLKRPLTFNTPPRPEAEVQKAEEVVTIPGAAAGETVAVILPSFTLADEAAIAAFEEHQLFWIGQHYAENVSATVAATAKEEIVALGRGRVAAGRTMEKVVRDALKVVDLPTGFKGTSAQYFEGLVANAATTQRVAAQLNSFIRLGYTEYTIVNPEDHRTCKTCGLTAGKVFTVEQGRSLLNGLIGAGNPADVRDIQPFLSTTQTAQITGGKTGADAASSKKLAARGNSMPPFHFRCRCNVDITEVEEVLPLAA